MPQIGALRYSDFNILFLCLGTYFVLSLYVQSGCVHVYVRVLCAILLSRSSSDGAAVVRINLFVRNILTISDIKMVSLLQDTLTTKNKSNPQFCFSTFTSCQIQGNFKTYSTAIYIPNMICIKGYFLTK